MTRPRSARRAHTLALVLAVVAPILLTTTPAPAASGPTGSLRLVTEDPVAGESGTLAGKVPTKGRREIRLQTLSDGRWRTIDKRRTSRRGSFRFVTTLLVGKTVYRGKAPRDGASPPSVTNRVTVNAAVAQPAGSLSLVVEGWGPSISSDGHTVAYNRFVDGFWTVRLNSTAAGTDVEVSPLGVGPVVAGDGSSVAFSGTGQTADTQGLFSWSRGGPARQIVPGSIGEGSEEYYLDPTAVAVSGAGRYIVYHRAEDPWRPDAAESALYVWDRTTESSVRIAESGSVAGDMSPDGECVVFSTHAALVDADVNGVDDVYLWSRSASLQLVSRAPDGEQHLKSSDSPTVSADCQTVAYKTKKSFDEGVLYLWDGQSGDTSAVTGTGLSLSNPALSHDGEYLAFNALTRYGAETGDGGIDVFLWDRATGFTTLSTDGNSVAHGDSWAPQVSADGRRIVYYSYGNQCSDTCPEVIVAWDRSD